MAESPSHYQHKDMAVRAMDPYARAKYEILLDWLNGRPAMNILNAGCGSGEFSHLLAQAGHRVTGIDLDEKYVAMAKETAHALGLNHCEFSAVSIENYQAPGLFDAVMATDVIEHTPDDEATMRKLLSMLKPGGTVIITVPAGQWMFGYHDEMLGHYRRYSRVSLCNLLNRHLKLEDARYFGFFLIPVCLWFSRWMRKEYPIADLKSGSAVKDKILSLILGIEKTLPFPLGTSLLAIGRSREARS